MRKVKFLSQVDESRCIGDKLCEKVCPTEAIKVVQKIAKIDEKKCIACFRCLDACQKDAIRIIPRSNPLILGVNPEEVDYNQLIKICEKADLHPRQYLCLCAEIRVEEGVAAILKGAKSPEEIALMTGARSGCGNFCMQPMLRLLKAHGVKIKVPKDHRWYNTTPTLWEIPADLERKYPNYYLSEDREVYRKIQK